MRKTTLFERLQARLITPYLDNNLWLLQEKGYNIQEISRTHDAERLKFFYPDIQLEVYKPEFAAFLKHNFSCYHYIIKNAVLEPDFGWAIINPFRIFKYSFPYTTDPWDAKKRRPKTVDYLSNNKNSYIIPEAISIKFGWQNYYHFFIDCLTQLALLDKYDPQGKIPIIVPQHFRGIRFVQDYLNVSQSVKREIIVHNVGEYIKVKKLHIIKDFLLSDNINHIVQSISNQPIEYKPRKIFITRSTKAGRTLLNSKDVLIVLKEFGYECIDCSEHSLQSQIQLFASASHVIGIHGAGLTNILFRIGKPLIVLEIFPSDTMRPEHYKNISKKYSFNYNELVGSHTDENNNFRLDVNKLRSKLVEISTYEP